MAAVPWRTKPGPPWGSPTSNSEALSPPDLRQGGAIPPDAEEAPSPTSRSRSTWPNSKPSSTGSGTYYNTPSGPIGPSGGERRRRPYAARDQGQTEETRPSAPRATTGVPAGTRIDKGRACVTLR